MYVMILSDQFNISFLPTFLQVFAITHNNVYIQDFYCNPLVHIRAAHNY